LGLYACSLFPSFSQFDLTLLFCFSEYFLRFFDSCFFLLLCYLGLPGCFDFGQFFFLALSFFSFGVFAFFTVGALCFQLIPCFLLVEGPFPQLQAFLASFFRRVCLFFGFFGFAGAPDFLFFSDCTLLGMRFFIMCG